MRPFGYWDCDLVAFKQIIEYNITSLVERRNRYMFISRNPSRHSAGIIRDLGPLQGHDLSSRSLNPRRCDQWIVFGRSEASLRRALR